MDESATHLHLERNTSLVGTNPHDVRVRIPLGGITRVLRVQNRTILHGLAHERDVHHRRVGHVRSGTLAHAGLALLAASGAVVLGEDVGAALRVGEVGTDPLVVGDRVDTHTDRVVAGLQALVDTRCADVLADEHLRGAVGAG